MKTAFSTLGCPEWSWEDMVTIAKDLGFDGIEVRGIGHEMYVPKAKCFREPELEKTIERLNRLRLEVPCLASACFLFDKANSDFYLQEGKDYIDLAAKLGAGFIRVLGEGTAEPGREEIDLDFVAKNLRVLAEYAADKKVTVLIETNGIFADSGKMLALLKRAPDPNVGVLWDIHHPFRFMGEPVEQTYDRLKDHIKYIHMKDSMMEGGRVRYKMVGHGDVPVGKILSLLKKDAYRGYVSLEWVKKWYQELEEPAVVFSHFLNYVRDFLVE